MTSRKKPGVAFWATVALVLVLVGYPLSLGPAVWLQTRGMMPKFISDFLMWFYTPLEFVEFADTSETRGPFGRALWWYVQLWVNPN
jgi:hypothetical protein